MISDNKGNLSLILRAHAAAKTAHGGQKRKYTGEPYIVHPIEVGQIVMSVPHDLCMVAAAYLHDTVEDTAMTIADIRLEFGDDVAMLVYELTDRSTTHHGLRERRKAFDRDNLAVASARAQTIKLADLISNTRSIVAHDPKFAKVYLREKLLLLGVLTRGDVSLWHRANDLLNLSIEKLELEAL